MKKRIQILVFIGLSLIGLTTQPAFASGPRAYYEIKSGLFSGPPKLIVDGVSFQPSFTGAYKIKQQFAVDSQAYRHAEEHERASRRASWSFWGAVAVAVANRNLSGDRFNENVHWGAIGLGAIGTILFQQSSLYHLNSAINSANGVVKPGAQTLLENSVPVPTRPSVSGEIALFQFSWSY